MAKRFTDTEKWRDEWWGSLSNDYRMVWLYLIDSCSIAGIWKKDFRGLNFNCNTNITEEEFIKVFAGRVIDRGGFFFIPKFVRFQNPKGLNSNKPAVLSVVAELQLNNLIPIIHELYGNGYLTIKGKGKGMVKDKEGEKEKEGYITVGDEKVFDVMPILEFNEAALNGRQKENKLRSWKDMVPEWFESNLKIAFNDEKHVLNSFSKYYLARGKPPNGVSGLKTKFTIEELNAVKK